MTIQQDLLVCTPDGEGVVKLDGCMHAVGQCQVLVNLRWCPCFFNLKSGMGSFC